MKFYRKSQRLDNVCYDIRGQVMREAQRMAKDGADILKLNLGNPAAFGFRAPAAVSDAMADMLVQTQGYSDSKGLVSARKAILRYCKKKNIPCGSIDDIYTGNGVSELIVSSMQALLNDGDEVLIPAPDYPLWTAAVSLAGGKAVHYICDESSDWMPDINDMRKKVTPKTKGIVVINPNNPTGALYPRDILEKIVELARENELILLADEIYDRLVMDGGEHIAIASLAPDLFTISYNGLSKSHLLCGYRCGWMCICGDRSRAADYIEGIDLLSSMRLCSNVPAQSLIPTALDECIDFTKELLVPGGRIYEQREAVCKGLSDIPGITFVRPKAAFYIFPKIDIERFGIDDDERLAYDLLKEKNILITHGSGFNWKAPDHFRIVYLPESDVIEKACRNMGEFFKKRDRSSDLFSK